MALKVALVAFEGTDTLAGTVMLPVDVNATVAAVACGPLNVTVQTATAPGASDEGVQEDPTENRGGNRSGGPTRPINRYRPSV